MGQVKHYEYLCKKIAALKAELESLMQYFKTTKDDTGGKTFQFKRLTYFEKKKQLQELEAEKLDIDLTLNEVQNEIRFNYQQA